jgi:hypothetical protein
MAFMPDHLKLTPDEQARLDGIHRAARIRHEKARKAAKRRGRHDFPLEPYECSWAYEQEFRRTIGK